MKSFAMNGRKCFFLLKAVPHPKCKRCIEVLSIVYCLLSIVSFSSCKKDSSLPETDKKFGYFPVSTGHWVIYDADSTYYDEFDNGKMYNYKFQVKEVIESEFIDNAGRKTLRIERYKRLNDTLPWEIKDVWYANRTETTAERVEENQRYIRLTFPPKAGATWNGNAYNPLGEQEYEYTEVDEPLLLNNTVFDSTLTVLQLDEFNLIEEKRMEEKYAKNAGLVYQENIFLKKDPAVFGKITGGFRYYMTVKSYGN